MKRYHEVACSYENGNRVGYALWDSVIKQPKYVQSSEFDQLVKDNEIQYLIMKDGELAVEYTDEELQAMHKNNADAANKITSIEEYFDNDMQISIDSFKKAKNHPDKLFCICGLPMKAPIVGSIFPIYLLGNEKTIEAFRIRNSVYYSVIQRITNVGMDGLYLLYLSAKFMDRSTEIFKGCIMDFNSCLRNKSVDDIKKTFDIKNPFAKNAKKSDIGNLIQYFNKVNEYTDLFLNLTTPGMDLF